MKRQRAFLDANINLPGQKKQRSSLAASSRGFPRLSGTASMARQLGATTSRTAVEKKNIDVINSPQIISGSTNWSTIIFLQNGLISGTGATNRVGRRCNIESILIRWLVNQSTDLPATEKRWLVVYDKQPDGISVPLLLDILADNHINAPMNLSNTDRFMVLHDEYIDRECGFNSYCQAGSWFKKFKEPLQMVWTGAGGAIPDITTGAIYLLWCQTGFSPAGQFGFHSRIRYTDA
jgi:hypothetical protein